MHLGDLDKDLQQKLAVDRKKTEQVYKQELEKLRLYLNQESQSVLKSIAADTKQIQGTINSFLKLCLILPGAIITSLLVAFLISSWAMTRSLTKQAQQIQQQKKTLETLKNQTWGIELYQTENGRFIILPPDSQQQTQWRCLGQPCIKI